MAAIVLVLHILIAAALIAVILLQKSEGGALSGLGGGNLGGMMSGRGTANLLTRTTTILAGCFMATSLLLALLASSSRGPQSILDRATPAATGPVVPLSTDTPASAPTSGARAPAAPDASAPNASAPNASSPAVGGASAPSSTPVPSAAPAPPVAPAGPSAPIAQ